MTFRNLRYLCAFRSRNDIADDVPAFAIYRDGRVIRFGTDRAEMIRLFNRAADRFPDLRISAVWAKDNFQPRTTVSPDIRRDPAYMRFWDAINEGRKLAGQPEALFANVHAMWAQAIVATPTEFSVAAERAAQRRLSRWEAANL